MKRWRLAVLAMAGAVALPATALAGGPMDAHLEATTPTGPVEYALGDPTFFEPPDSDPCRRARRSRSLAGWWSPRSIASTGSCTSPRPLPARQPSSPGSSPCRTTSPHSAASEYSSTATARPGSPTSAPRRWRSATATDYEGLGGPGPHPSIIGVSEGRSMLDASRAAGQVPGVYLSDTTAIAGFSQGGHAALWAT